MRYQKMLPFYPHSKEICCKLVAKNAQTESRAILPEPCNWRVYVKKRTPRVNNFLPMFKRWRKMINSQLEHESYLNIFLQALIKNVLNLNSNELLKTPPFLLGQNCNKSSMKIFEIHCDIVSTLKILTRFKGFEFFSKISFFQLKTSSV